ncbi:MAG: CRISPR-associated protein Cas4 [Candidatus Dadabacteria bacterium]|nr:MAG: CRISPR-associated protein Cas4 [Candidatus Dadabacteria bacterium]
MRSEADLLPLSGLQHLVFCERQAGLMLVEQIWEDNVFTVQGTLRHRNVHEESPRRERRGDLIIVRGLPLRSLELGVSGVADVVEFHRTDDATGVMLTGCDGRWQPFPVEYKRGRPKIHRADEVQLCAQAICIEDMLGTRIDKGALYYGQPRRRTEVAMDDSLRELTWAAARRLHELVSGGITPPAIPKKECRACSLVEICLPSAVQRQRVEPYLDRIAEDEEW